MYRGERFNAYSHLIGAILAIVGTVLLLIQSAHSGNPYRIVSSAIYGASLIFLYVISTLYHSVRSTHAKGVLQKFDHCAIYILIAGSYTPFTLTTLNGGWGWSLFGVSWGLALFGIAQELTLGRKTRILSMILYVVMGWLVLIAIYPLMQRMSLPGLFWLALGGVAYSIGIYWFVNDEKIPHGHGIWHIFVLIGSIAQFICVYAYVH
ncbi:hemolysin III family protein [Snodgrassella sp. CFCC 13594]|uniref:PAQR family membrane homeostasis protein TrhA n=1 Tax=Snodgrassella sp. CFCC 13594 TaxID=1775559 RepID=UPI00082EDE0B|nr:hemolysin III family protein [Snodgrassella sp. CFCC 13594]